MSKTIREIMSPNPATLKTTASAVDAARLMRESNVGCVAVLKDSRLYGIITDRDLVVRVTAKGLDPSAVRLENICTREPACLSSSSSTDDAVRMMKEKAVRRIPVVEEGKVVGVLSLGDLAVALDPHSALAEISRSTPNR